MKNGLSNILSAFLLVALLGVPAAFAQDEPVTLNFVTLSGDWQGNMQRVIDAFEAQHPNIRVQMENYPFRQLFEVIEIRMQAGTPDVDLISVDVPLVANYSIRGLLHPLDEYFTEAELTNTWIDASWQAGMYEGSFMAAPQNTSTQFMYLNLTHFREQGVEPPPHLNRDDTRPIEEQVEEVVQGRWTWEQVVDAAQALTVDTTGDGQINVWGLLFGQVSRPYQMLALPESLNQPSVSADGLSTDGYLNAPGWIQAGQFYHDLFSALRVSPRGITADETGEAFMAGRIAIFVQGEWGLIPYSEVEGFELGVAAHPFFEEGRVATPTGSWHVGISTFSEQKDAAAEFIRFISLTPEGSRVWYESHGQFPATLELLDAIDNSEATTVFPRSAYRLGAYEARNTAVPRPSTPGYLEWEDIVAQTLEDIRNGEDPAQALNAAVPRIDRILARYGRQ